MEIITRNEAISKGLKTYFTGKACKHGHVSERYTTGVCIKCNSSRQEYNAKHRQENVEYIKERQAKWYQENSEYRIERDLQWQKDNPDKVSKKNANYRASKLQATASWGNQEAIQAFYTEAKRLEELTGIQFHVDHIVPLQGKNVSGLHYEGNLQVIPAYENLKKSNKFEDAA